MTYIIICVQLVFILCFANEINWIGHRLVIIIHDINVYTGLTCHRASSRQTVRPAAKNFVCNLSIFVDLSYGFYKMNFFSSNLRVRVYGFYDRCTCNVSNKINKKKL